MFVPRRVPNLTSIGYFFLLRMLAEEIPSAQYPKGALSAAFRSGYRGLGMNEKYYYHAVAKLLEFDPDERVDLVRIGDVRDSMRDGINKNGVLR